MNRKEYLGIVIAFVVICFIPFLCYYKLYEAGLIFGAGDVFHGLSSVLFTSKSLGQGEGIPFWAPWLANGIPYLADSSLPALYPPMFLFVFLSPIDFAYAYYGFHLAIGSIFFYLYLRIIGCEIGTGVCVAFLYLFSIHLGGYRKEHLVIIAEIIWLPMLLFFIECYIREYKPKYFLGIVLGLVIQFLGGFPQVIVYTDIFVILYFVVVSSHFGINWKFIFDRLVGIFGAYIGLIAIQLLPTLELLLEYNNRGALRLPSTTFCAGSTALWKIIMLLFPKFYGEDIYNYGGATVSSGMDIELFLGTLLCVFFCLSLRYLNVFYIRFSVVIMVGSFLIASHANVPIISKLLSCIPIINNMRYMSRILFIFILFGYILFAMVLEEVKRRNDWRYILSSTKYVLGFAICAASCIGWYYGKEAFLITIWNRTGTNLVVLMFFLLFLYIFYKKSYRYTICTVVVTLVALWELIPYWYVSYSASADHFSIQSTFVSDFNCQFARDQYKLLDARADYDRINESPAFGNTPLNKHIMTINSYMSFNNPWLYQLLSRGKTAYLNTSGLLYRFDTVADIADLLQNKQKLLSMLGVKYIKDSSRVLDKDSHFYDFLHDKEIVFHKSEFVFASQKPYHVESFPLKEIKPNTLYFVSFDCLPMQQPNFFYVDFYGNETGDISGARVDFQLQSNTCHRSGNIYSGDIQDGKKLFLRIVSDTKADLKISNFSVSSYKKSVSGEYRPIGRENGQTIFENPYARSLFYVPMAIKSMQSFEPLYLEPELYEIDKVSYILDNQSYEKFTPCPATISDVSLSNNIMKAFVNAEAETFVNFSQNWYPGWKAYIDGKETKIYLVNGLIQGVFVPAGNHELLFSYFPNSLKLGIVISLITLFVLIIYMFKQYKNEALIYHN